MKSFRALLLGLVTGVAPLFIVGVAIHFAMGIDQAIDAIREGKLSYISVAAFLLLVCVLSGAKVFTAVSAIKTAVQFDKT